MIKECPKRSSMLKGIDVSKWQTEIDWSKVEQDGVGFAFIRAAYSTTEDRLDDGSWGFRENWQLCGKTSIKRGAYQWLTPSKAPQDQAHFLCDRIEAHGLNWSDLPPVVDVEDEDLKGTDILSKVLEWCSVVEKRLNRVPIIYTTPYFWNNNVTIMPMRYPLWISHVKTDCPLMPESWPCWTFWQHSWEGSVDGIGGKVDLNWFDGDRSHLDVLNHMLVPEVYNQMELNQLLKSASEERQSKQFMSVQDVLQRCDHATEAFLERNDETPKPAVNIRGESENFRTPPTEM